MAKFMVSIAEEHYGVLEKKADKMGITIQDCVRLAVYDWLEKNGKRPVKE